jgi:hypothetical protein
LVKTSFKNGKARKTAQVHGNAYLIKDLRAEYAKNSKFNNKKTSTPITMGKILEQTLAQRRDMNGK